MPKEEVDRAKRLGWTVPGAFKRAMHRESRRGKKPDYVPWLIMIGISGAMIGAMVFRGEPFLADNWPISVAVSLLLPAALILGVVWISLRGGDVAIISDKGFNHNGMVGATMMIRYWPWDKIVECRLGPVEVDEESFDAITLLTRNGGEYEVALSDKVTYEQVAAALRANGIAVENAPG